MTSHQNHEHMRLPLFAGGALLAGVAIFTAGYCAGFHETRGNDSFPTTGKNHPANRSLLAASSSEPETKPLFSAEQTTTFPRDPIADLASVATAPETPDGDRRLAANLESLAATRPGEALAQALDVRHLRCRTLLLERVFRSWGSHNPAAALAASLALPAEQRSISLAAVLATSCATHPDAALALTQQASAANPSLVPELGATLVEALSESGNFADAARYADSAPAEYRDQWTLTAYERWATYQPQQAAKNLQSLPEGARTTALLGLTNGWAASAPWDLASYALNLPAAGARREVVTKALQSWIRTDVKAAATWIVQNPDRPELDAAVADIALLPDFVQHTPEDAIAWSESITEPHLRSSILAAVLRQSTGDFRTTARDYAARSPLLTPTDRASLSADLAPPPEAAP